MAEGGPFQATLEDGVLVVRLDDGKANALSHDRIGDLHAALDRATEEASSICFVGRPGVFSGGFDLKIMQAGPAAATGLVGAGGELLMRVYVHPQPTVAAVTGHALAAGALLALTCDTRVGPTDVDAKIGLNETTIGMSLPEFATALAAERLTAREFTRATIQGTVYAPAEAVAAGYLDRLAPAAELETVAADEARRLGALPASAYATTKRRVREDLATGVLERLADDLGSFVTPGG